jgi:hypothetical protein
MLQVEPPTITTEDLEVAEKLTQYLHEFDQYVFPHQPINIYGSDGTEIPVKKGNDIVFESPTQIRFARIEDELCYIFPVNGLKELIVRHYSQMTVGIGTPGIHFRPSLDSFIAAVAAHEVRHRVQHTWSSSGFIQPEDTRAHRDLIDYVNELSKHPEINLSEFDALLVEGLVARAIQTHGGVRESCIRSIITLSRTTLESVMECVVTA